MATAAVCCQVPWYTSRSQQPPHTRGYYWRPPKPSENQGHPRPAGSMRHAPRDAEPRPGRYQRVSQIVSSRDGRRWTSHEKYTEVLRHCTNKSLVRLWNTNLLKSSLTERIVVCPCFAPCCFLLHWYGSMLQLWICCNFDGYNHLCSRYVHKKVEYWIVAIEICFKLFSPIYPWATPPKSKEISNQHAYHAYDLLGPDLMLSGFKKR